MMFPRKILLSVIIFIVWTTCCTEANADDAPVIQKPTTENKIEIFLKDDDVHNWTSPNFPNPYPPENQFLIIKCDVGYSVSIEIQKLDLDSGNGDFLVIKPGTTLEEDSEGRVFTYMLKKNETYLVNSNNVFMSLQVSGKNEIGKTGYSLTYKRVGTLKQAPTDPPTTPSPLPADDDSTNLIVYVAVTELESNSSNIQANFQVAVSKMATEYCQLNNIQLNKEITTESVQINYFTQCPFSWPERDSCMKIYFAVPVHVVENSTWSGYQLTTFHLDRMWHTLGNKYLEQNGMKIYEQPANESTLNWWIIILCCTILLFAVLIYLLKVLASNIPNYQFNKKNLNRNRTIPGCIRSKTLTLNPYPYSQSTPPIFGNDNYGYKQFGADLSVTKKPVRLETDHQMTDSDEEIFSNIGETKNHKSNDATA